MRSFDGSSTPGSGKYILDPGSGKPAVSVPDTQALASAAKALGVPYFQRTGGSDDAPASDFTSQDVNAVLTDGREKKNRIRYLQCVYSFYYQYTVAVEFEVVAVILFFI